MKSEISDKCMKKFIEVKLKLENISRYYHKKSSPGIKYETIEKEVETGNNLNC